jgi:hypothetical protein
MTGATLLSYGFESGSAAIPPLANGRSGGELQPCIYISSAVNLHIIPLMMEVEMVSETLGFYPQLTQLVAQEDFIKFSRHESFRSYM